MLIILALQCQRKQGFSVVLYLDMKNEVDTMNHRAIFYAQDAKGFPEPGISLFLRMYTGSFLVVSNHFGTFLVMSNRFGRSAACVLSRGMPKGAPPSPVVFGTTIDPMHSIVLD